MDHLLHFKSSKHFTCGNCLWAQEKPQRAAILPHPIGMLSVGLGEATKGGYSTTPHRHAGFPFLTFSAVWAATCHACCKTQHHFMLRLYRKGSKKEGLPGQCWPVRSNTKQRSLVSSPGIGRGARYQAQKSKKANRPFLLYHRGTTLSHRLCRVASSTRGGAICISC